MSISINVAEEFDDAQQAAYALEHIAELIRQGYTSGYEPVWSIAGEEEYGDKPEGYAIGHDVNGYFFVRPDESDPDEAGFSLGFDGRKHYETEEDAWQGAREDSEASE